MENLNKEFFNGLRTKFPYEMKHFDTWLGNYKSEVKWGILFFDHTPFCDIPYDMQAGVLMRYAAEISRPTAIENEFYIGPADMKNMFTKLIQTRKP
jgi:hypothetical protein